jgi:1-aminocyclopropane-1-carboxylate deaminase/D-cysteine desulfhydrase-like pyridoxal-dependent ACC family enzyme
MEEPDIRKISIDKIQDGPLQNKKVELDVLRLDKIHPVISGNKWLKLKYHLVNFNAGNYKGILTFGGAWSNHIVATACVCCLQKIDCVGIIRGERPPQLSATLVQARKHNMQLKFISREQYKQKNKMDFLEEIKKEFPGYYIVPEGGAGNDGEKGASEILQLITQNIYTHIACAVGTGTMFNGILRSASPDQEVMGIVVLKGWDENGLNAGKFFYNYHFGGYAKTDPTLFDFMNYFFRLTGVPTDFVYTGKLAFAIFDLIKKEYFLPTSKILMIHSGGLQGNASLQKGSLIF